MFVSMALYHGIASHYLHFNKYVVSLRCLQPSQSSNSTAKSAEKSETKDKDRGTCDKPD